jgi:hypothetical protein
MYAIVVLFPVLSSLLIQTLDIFPCRQTMLSLALRVII